MYIKKINKRVKYRSFMYNCSIGIYSKKVKNNYLHVAFRLCFIYLT